MSTDRRSPVAVKASPGRFRVRGRIGPPVAQSDLSAAAKVRSRLLNSHGRVLKRAQLGMLRSGTNNVRVRLPRALQRGTYRLMLDATGDAGTAHALVRIKVGSSSACPAR